MKGLLIAIFLLFVSACAFCQVNLNGTQGNMLMLSVGADKTFVNNQAFDLWTRQHYNKTEGYLISGYLDLAFIVRSYDFGIYINASYPYENGAVYFGKKLTSPQSKISSYLNFDIGDFQGLYNGIAPVNYTLTASQKGKSLQLQYNAAYIGLSSKNYLNGLAFKRGKGRKGVSFNTGFFFDMGYEPWNGDWEYGYYTGYGKYASFKGTKAYGISQLDHLFFNAGLFFGMGS